MPLMSRRIARKLLDADPRTASGRALLEERYRSLRRQVPILYLLGFVNLSGMELATGGKLVPGFNLPTFVATCGILRLWSWFSPQRKISHRIMARRLLQTILFAAIVCIGVCLRCIYLLASSDPAAHMAVMLFGGLTAIATAYGLTALPAAGRVPLILIVLPLAAMAPPSEDPQLQLGSFGLVVAAALTMRLLGTHNRQLTDVITSRTLIASQQERAENARREALLAATTDVLTGLPNRRAFVSALEQEIHRDACWGPFTLAFLDLDRFKQVNDTLGHQAGDDLLREVSARLVRAIGSNGVVARLGGDEFAVLLPGIESPVEARFVGAHILNEVNQPISLGGRSFPVSISCGFAIAERGKNLSPSRLMADADLALYEAKASNGVSVFEERIETPRRRRLKIERALQCRGVEDQLRLEFQPIVDLNSRTIIAHEALARWTDPELGAVAPSEFVPVAEQLHIIDGINNRLLNKAIEQATGWPSAIKLSFNLSGLQLCTTGSAEAILAVLRSAGLPAERLQVEVTETTLLADFDTARANLNALKMAGVTVVLDDFGAGFASIGYLRELRFDQIKLDGALVTAAKDSIDGRRLLRAVISLCDILGVLSVAEHVESEELLTLLKDLGCTAGQGFWLHAPVPADDLVELHQAGLGTILLDSDGRRAA